MAPGRSYDRRRNIRRLQHRHHTNDGWIDPEVLCLDVTHEVGHVILGPDAFPNNPTEPSESPDPNNIMYVTIFDQHTAQCTAMLNKIYPPPHPKEAPSEGFVRTSRGSGGHQGCRKCLHPAGRCNDRSGGCV